MNPKKHSFCAQGGERLSHRKLGAFITSKQTPHIILPWGFCFVFCFLTVKTVYFTKQIYYLSFRWCFCGTRYCQAHHSKICQVLLNLNIKITDYWNLNYLKKKTISKNKRIVVGPHLFLRSCFPWKHTERTDSIIFLLIKAELWFSYC